MAQTTQYSANARDFIITVDRGHETTRVQIDQWNGRDYVDAWNMRYSGYSTRDAIEAALAGLAVGLTFEDLERDS